MKVSIVTGTYNSEKYVKDCVSSINNQSYPDIEHIIIDGASKDNTVQAIKQTPNRIGTLISEPDTGIYNAMNKGLRLAKGDVIGILNSDDFYDSDKVIQMVVDSFSNSDVGCIYGNLYYVDQDRPENVKRTWITGSYNPEKGFRTGWHPAHPSFFVKKEVYEKYGYFDEAFRLAADFEIMLRFLEKYKVPSAYIDFPMVRMRLGGASNKSWKNTLQGNKECVAAFKKNDIAVSPLYPMYRLVPKLKQFF